MGEGSPALRGREHTFNNFQKKFCPFDNFHPSRTSSKRNAEITTDDFDVSFDSVESKFDTFRHGPLIMLLTSLIFSDLREEKRFGSLAPALPLSMSFTGTSEMLKISTVETQVERRLVVEGKLIQPWVGELRKSWRVAGADLNGRKLVVDLTHATVIGPEGEEALLGLMQEGARFFGCGVLTKHMLKAMAARCHGHVGNGDKKQSTG